MKTADILEYAALAVGFKVWVGKYVVVEPVCHGVDKYYIGRSSEPFSIGRVTDIKMLPFPDQLTVTVEITINEAKDSRILQRFSERPEAGDFPFRQTAADLEAERELKRKAMDEASAKRAAEDKAKAEKRAMEDAALDGARAAREENARREKERKETDPAYKSRQEELLAAYGAMGMDGFYD